MNTICRRSECTLPEHVALRKALGISRRSVREEFDLLRKSPSSAKPKNPFPLLFHKSRSSSPRATPSTPAVMVQKLEAFVSDSSVSSSNVNKSRLQSHRALGVVDPSQTTLGPGWFEETYTKLLKGVDQGLLEPDILMQFHAQPLWVLQDMSNSMRDQLKSLYGNSS